MKIWKFHGNIVPLGRKPLDPVAVQAFHAKGMFHELVKSAPDVQPPPETTYRNKASAALSLMLGNGPDPANPPQFPNGVGDCAIAGDQHLEALRVFNAGGAYVPTTADTLAEYSAVTGFNVNDPNSDQGTDPMALYAWRKTHPYPSGSVMVDAVAVDASSPEKVKEACWLAVGLNLAMAMPDDWENLEDNNDVWDVAGPPNPANGHDPPIVDYDENYVYLNTWGEIIRLTWAALAKYGIPSAGGMCTAELVSDCVSKMTQKAPSGYDFSALDAFLAQGTALPPSAAPAPASAPAFTDPVPPGDLGPAAKS